MKGLISTSDAASAAAAIDIWENEGGATGSLSMDHVYGRRIEADQSWTVYHVFTGVPADAGDGAMMGLSRVNATDRMLALNLNNLGRRRNRARLKPATGDFLDGAATDGDGSTGKTAGELWTE